MKFFDRNICTFIPNTKHVGDLQILHLVYETKPQTFCGWQTNYFFRMHCVVEGKGVLHTQNGEFQVKEGDVFFSFPSMPYYLETQGELKYIYVGYLGERGVALCDKFKLSAKNCVIADMKELTSLFVDSLKIPTDFSDLYCEGLLLCAFAEIAEKTADVGGIKKKKASTAELIKKYVDDNLSDPSLSLESIAKALSYTTKHVSKVFKQANKVSFKEYLNAVRINNALSLMNGGFSSIKEIAFLCGFNDALYFSKVFKKFFSQSPREYLAELKKDVEEKAKR
jgi:AraC-like DNA-binding protein/mannose-6-phosphate isomerase-like protein (cupin superfamily)